MSSDFTMVSEFPYSSLKYHILLTCALYYNFNQKHQLNELYLCEDCPVDSEFQIIFQDSERVWAILPNRKDTGLTKVYPFFWKSWERRKRLSIGGDCRELNSILSSIGSWSAALACIEDFSELI